MSIFASELYEVFDFLYELRKLNRKPDLYGLGDSMFEDFGTCRFKLAKSPLGDPFKSILTIYDLGQF